MSGSEKKSMEKPRRPTRHCEALEGARRSCVRRARFCISLEFGPSQLRRSSSSQAMSGSEKKSMEKPRRPTRIILVRHGQSEGNLDEKKYCTIADSNIRLTQSGLAQAEACGCTIKDIIQKGSVEEEDWRVYFYVSPYRRTLSTLKGIGRAFDRERILGVREEPRLREQDFGNFQEETRMALVKDLRKQFGRFFYRFPEGESGSDVFDRVTSFLESLWRDMDTYRLNRSRYTDLNLVIVFHGLTMRIFLMRWFKWTVKQFERLNNPKNCEIRVMQLGEGGEYSLAVHHSRQELEEWGLSPEMILEQEWRAKATRGQWYQDWPCFTENFFDHLGSSSSPQDPNEYAYDDEAHAEANDNLVLYVENNN